MYGEDTTGDSIGCPWFRKFRDGERSCRIHARSGRLLVIIDEDFGNEFPTPNHRKISGTNHQTFLVHGTTVERLVDVCAWPSHQARSLVYKQREERISTYVSLLSCNSGEQFLDRIITGDEKLILYRNMKHRRTVSRCCRRYSIELNSRNPS